MKNAEEPQVTASPEEPVTDSASCSSEGNEEARPAPTPEAISNLIRKRVYAAVAMGFVPIPLADLAGLTAIQVEMLRALCKAHGIPFQSQWVKSAISSLCSGGVTVATVPLFSSLLKAIPVIGMTAGAATLCLTGAASTYALGCVFDRHFRDGGTLKDFDTQKSKAYFAEKLEEGKELAKKMMPGKKAKDAAQADPQPAKDAAKDAEQPAEPQATSEGR